jgi:hypothetical protein
MVSPILEKSTPGIMKKNIYTIVLYSLSFSIALALNDLIVTIFDSFPGTQHIITKTTYLMLLFGVTMLIIYLFSNNAK